MGISERLFMLLKSTPGKNQTGLCKVLGLNPNIATNWKQRNTDPPARYIVQICNYLGVSIEYLLTGNENQFDYSQQLRNTMSDDEMRIVTKYRALDDDGKDAVKGVLLAEQRRVETQMGLGSDAVS